MEICSHDKCSGCNSCVNVCPHGCISMEEDALGVMHPVIDEHRCVHCNLCVRSCPNNVELEFNYPLKCYASWVTDKEKRRICASGGIGTALSEYVIRHGGVVFGSRYDDNMFPVMSYAETLDELECYKGSRYVQSVVGGDTFHKVKHFLVNDRLVLFVGTPCQVAGLKTFLKKDFNNLITVDLICHGVCPTRYFVDEVEYLKQRCRINSLGDVRFRGNDGNNFRLSLWGKNGRRLFPRSGIFEKIFRIDEAQQFYIWGFLMGVSMRENCYSCKFSRPERISDVTIGDFIGIGNIVPFGWPKENVSSVTMNTPKGESFYEVVSSENDSLVNISRDYRERLEYGPSLRYAFPRHKLNANFKKNYKVYGFVKGIRKTLRMEQFCRVIGFYLHNWSYVFHWLIGRF